MDNESSNRTPAWWIALIPFAVLVGLLVLVIRFFGADALDGGSQVSLLIASAVCIAIAMLVYKVSWKTLDEAIMDNVRSLGSAIFILLMIGAVSGSWMVSGVVPTLIYYGLKVLTPGIFLFAACVICALVSIVTGSSWTTIATLGVAFIGIGDALGFSAGWTAGAVISGAYFGDKISPLSDTTVLASSTTGTPLFTHIRYMMITTVPSITIASVIFLLVSIFHRGDASIHAGEISDALAGAFNLSPWLLLVPVFTGVLIARKVPALATLFLSALAAGIVALIAQPGIIAEIGGAADTGGTGATLDFRSAFRGLWITWYGDTAVQTGSESLDSLIETGGMRGMLSTIFLIFCAGGFGGVLKGSGMIDSLTAMLTRRVSSRTGVVSSTVATGVFSNMVTGDQYLSIILVSNLFKELYEDKGYESRLLSRSAEDSATVTSVLIPWNSCGMTQATVLKVPTLEYLPYCFFNIISPLMSVFIAAIGYKIFRTRDADSC